MGLVPAQIPLDLVPVTRAVRQREQSIRAPTQPALSVNSFKSLFSGTHIVCLLFGKTSLYITFNQQLIIDINYNQFLAIKKFIKYKRNLYNLTFENK